MREAAEITQMKRVSPCATKGHALDDYCMDGGDAWCYSCDEGTDEERVPAPVLLDSAAVLRLFDRLEEALATLDLCQWTPNNQKLNCPICGIGLWDKSRNGHADNCRLAAVLYEEES